VDVHDTMKDMDAEQVNNNNFANNKQPEIKVERKEHPLPSAGQLDL